MKTRGVRLGHWLAVGGLFIALGIIAGIDQRDREELASTITAEVRKDVVARWVHQ